MPSDGASPPGGPAREPAAAEPDSDASRTRTWQPEAAAAVPAQPGSDEGPADRADSGAELGLGLGLLTVTVMRPGLIMAGIHVGQP